MLKAHCDQCDKVITSISGREIAIIIKTKEGQKENIFYSRSCAANNILQIPYLTPATEAR